MRKLRTLIRRYAAYRDLLWLGLILFLVIFTRMHVGFAAGEGSEQIVSAGTGLDGTFDTKLKELALGAIKAMQIVLLIMTAIAGMMSTFGLEEGKNFCGRSCSAQALPSTSVVSCFPIQEFGRWPTSRHL